MALIAREIITLPISGARMITVFSPNAKKKKKKKKFYSYFGLHKNIKPK